MQRVGDYKLYKMPDTESPADIPETTSSRTSINDLTSSGSDSLTSSNYELELSASKLPDTSSSSEFDVALPGPKYSIFGEKLRLPIDFNLKQLLIKVTKTEDLESVSSLRLRVIARDFSLQHLPNFLPNLRELNLDGSCLMSLRDLGCRLKSLTILHVCRTGLNSLDGLLGLSGLIELYAANNNIKDVSPCSALHRIKVIDLAHNVIKDTNAVSFLVLCTTLKHLFLNGNPTTAIDKYRATVKEILPNLESLDGIDYINLDSPIGVSLESLNLEDNMFARNENRFSPIHPKNIPQANPDKNIKFNKRPHTTGSMDTSRKQKLLPARPATAHNIRRNDFNCIVSGANFKLRDVHQMFIPTKLTIGKPMCGNPALGLWEKKHLQTWDDESE